MSDRTSPEYRARQRLRHRARSLGWTASRNPATGWSLTGPDGAVIGKDLADEAAGPLIAAATVRANIAEGRLPLQLLSMTGGCPCAADGGACSCGVS